MAVTTYSRNGLNRLGLSRSNTSGYRGVKWSEKRQRWVASIKIDGTLRYLGVYTRERFLDACQAVYDFLTANGIPNVQPVPVFDTPGGVQ